MFFLNTNQYKKNTMQKNIMKSIELKIIYLQLVDILKKACYSLVTFSRSIKLSISSISDTTFEK